VNTVGMSRLGWRPVKKAKVDCGGLTIPPSPSTFSRSRTRWRFNQYRAELSRHCGTGADLAPRLEGFEPPTSGSVDRRSVQLSYRREILTGNGCGSSARNTHPAWPSHFIIVAEYCRSTAKGRWLTTGLRALRHPGTGKSFLILVQTVGYNFVIFGEQRKGLCRYLTLSISAGPVRCV
jgi:rRNA maturation protein Nop10